MSDVPSVPDLAVGVEALFERQIHAFRTAGKMDVRTRISHLRSLEKALLAWRRRLQEALRDDFGKPPQEVDLVDIYYVLHEIRYVRRHLRRWMRTHTVATPLAFIGSRAGYFYEPKGVVLIVSPWNYPVNLTLAPLVCALAAGCRAILKPSEMTPHTTGALKSMLAEIFPEDLVAVVEGDATISKQLTELPFHHIFFTGSAHVGSLVMQAAAKTLASVTLELGGKCPAVVEPTANIRRTAQRIIQTKFINAGQTCVAPDYVLVHSSIHDKLVEALRVALGQFYPDANTLESQYCQLIHERHLHRMTDLLKDAVQNGATVISGGNVNTTSRRMEPTILTHVADTAQVMHEEIFGPILPIVPYETTEDAIRFVNSGDRPLGLYVFGHGRRIDEIVRSVPAGGCCINHCALNYYNPRLPFGGLNHSGIGKSHGFAGFTAFSNVRGVYKHTWRYAPIDWLHAPYTKAKQYLIDFVLRWL